MKGLFTVVVLLNLAGSLVAQPSSSYLDTTYNLDGRSDWLLGLEQVGSKYYSSSWSNANGIADYGIEVINPLGRMDSLKIFEDTSTYEVGIDIVSIGSGKLAIAIQNKDLTNDHYNYGLSIVDTNFHVIATDVRGIDTLHEGCQALCYSNGRIVITGSRRNPRHPGNQDVYLAAWDTTANFLWDRKVGTPQHNENSYGIVPTSDGGFMIAGYRQYLSNNRFDWLIIKTDSLGNQEWEKTFTNSGYRNWSEGIVTDGLGNHYAMGFTQVNSSIHGFKARVIKINEGGLLQWDRTYVDDSFGIGNYELERGIINADGDIVIVGGLRDTASNKDVGWLLKLKPNGDKVWSRTIAHQTDDHQYLRDLEQTPDGGYLLVGSVFNNPNDAWVVKVDSVGCMVEDCDSIKTGTPPEPIPDDLYLGNPVPNPTTGAVTISYQLPPGTSGIIQFMDIHGRVLQSYKVVEGISQLDLDLSLFPKGIIFCTLKTEQWPAQSRTIVIQ